MEWYEEDELARVKRAAEFKDQEVPDEKTFNTRLRTLPFIQPSLFLKFASQSQEPLGVQQVPLNRILGFQPGAENGWNVEPSGGSLWSLAKLIKRGEFDYRMMNGIVLSEFGGFYFISANGRHRVAAMKAMSGPVLSVRARVGRILPFAYAFDNSGWVKFDGKRLTHSYFLPKESRFRELEARRKAGLWDGRLVEVSLIRRPAWKQKLFGERVSSALWEVSEMSAPWVFAADLAKAKSLCEKSLSS